MSHTLYWLLVLLMMPPGAGHLFLCGFGHDVAGLRRQTGAFQLDGGVFDVKLLRSNLPDGVEQALALVQVHVGNPRMQAERIVTAAKRPQVDVDRKSTRLNSSH